MGRIVELLNMIGTRAHEIAHAAEQMEKETSAAQDRAATLDDKAAVVERLQAEEADLAASVAKLKEDKARLEGEIQALLNRFRQ